MTLHRSHFEICKNFYRPHSKDGGRYCFQFVCQFTSRGGGGGGTPVRSRGGYPIPSLAGGVPHPRSRRGEGGTPSQVWMGGGGTQGTPPTRSGWGTPQTWDGYPPQTWDGVPPTTWEGVPPRPGMGYPPQTWDGIPPWTWDGVPPQTWDGSPPGPETGYPPWTWDGYPLDLGWGTPPRPEMGYPAPPQTWDGVPPPDLGHSEHLPRGGRYASCVHAGGLSCYNCLRTNNQRVGHLSEQTNRFAFERARLKNTGFLLFTLKTCTNDRDVACVWYSCATIIFSIKNNSSRECFLSVEYHL